jgi:autophagy-related protein 33
MDASYEVLGDSNSEGAGSASEAEEEINGEEIRSAMEGFRFSQSVRAAISGAAFLMSVVGIWGDGF